MQENDKKMVSYNKKLYYIVNSYLTIVTEHFHRISPLGVYVTYHARRSFNGLKICLFPSI